MITFISIGRKNPKTGAVQYHAMIPESIPAELDEIARLISDSCTVNVADIKAVLKSLEDNIIYLLLSGRSVRLGDLGSFHLNLTSKGMETEEEVDENCIKQLRVHFTKSAYMKRAVRKDAPMVHFTKKKNERENSYSREVKEFKKMLKERMKAAKKQQPPTSPPSQDPTPANEPVEET